MHKSNPRLTRPLLLLPLFILPLSLRSQSLFDGTWRINIEQSKISVKPYVVMLNKRTYYCSSCRPAVRIKSDGTDQPVSGQPFDTAAVQEVDSKSIVLTTKKRGKILWKLTRTVSDDGNTLSEKGTLYPENNGQAVNWEDTYSRIGKPVPASHAISGSWRTEKTNNSKYSLRETTYEWSGGQLSMSATTGESFTAKLNGQDHLVKAGYDYNAVSLRRIDAFTIEEADKLDGKVVDFWKMTVAPNGRTMTLVEKDRRTGQISTYLAEKK
jgi:hypothetical protein